MFRNDTPLEDIRNDNYTYIEEKEPFLSFFLKFKIEFIAFMVFNLSDCRFIFRSKL